MIDLLEKIIQTVTNFFESVIAFFSNILTILGVLADTFMIAVKLILSVTSGTQLTTVMSLMPAFAIPFVFFLMVKGVINLVT